MALNRRNLLGPSGNNLQVPPPDLLNFSLPKTLWPLPVSPDNYARTPLFCTNFVSRLLETREPQLQIATLVRKSVIDVNEGLKSEGVAYRAEQLRFVRLTDTIRAFGSESVKHLAEMTAWLKSHETASSLTEARGLEDVSNIPFRQSDKELFVSLRKLTERTDEHHSLDFGAPVVENTIQRLAQQFSREITKFYKSPESAVQRPVELLFVIASAGRIFHNVLLQSIGLSDHKRALVLGPVAEFASHAASAMVAHVYDNVCNEFKIAGGAAERLPLFTDCINFTNKISKNNPAAEYAVDLQILLLLSANQSLAIGTRANWSSAVNNIKKAHELLPSPPSYSLIRPSGTLFYLRATGTADSFVVYSHDGIDECESVGYISPEFDAATLHRWGQEEGLALHCCELYPMAPNGSFRMVHKNRILQGGTYQIEDHANILLEETREKLLGELNEAAGTMPEIFANLSNGVPSVVLRTGDDWYLGGDSQLVEFLEHARPLPQNEVPFGFQYILRNHLKMVKLGVPSPEVITHESEVDVTEADAEASASLDNGRHTLVQAIRIQAISFEDLIQMLSKFEVKLDSHRGQGVHPILVRQTPLGEKQSTIPTHATESSRYLQMLIPSILRHLGISAEDGARAIRAYWEGD